MAPSIRMAAWALLALPIVVLGLARLGLLSGRPPTDLGVRDGRLKPPAVTPNSVHSQADLHPGHPMASRARIAPLPAGPAGAALRPLRERIEAWPGARIVEQRSDYLRVEFATRWLRFVDDAEFWHDPTSGTVQLRSASRLGKSDLGANRARIEALRAALTAP